jgi:hypothetical protein
LKGFGDDLENGRLSIEQVKSKNSEEITKMSQVKTRTVIQALAGSISARSNSYVAGNKDWFEKHSDRAKQLIKDFLPSGGGFDSGCTVDFEASSPETIVIHTSFHHMNDNGFYDGWTEHKITIRPSFISEIDIKVSGINRNEIKDYIAETFEIALTQLVSFDAMGEKFILWANDPQSKATV